MPDIQISDHLGNAIPAVKIDLSEPSSILPYARAEVLHLAVFPDFEELAPEKLSTAAAKPISFDLALQQEFELGATKPEIHLTPDFLASLEANTTKGSDVLQTLPFGSGVLVPARTGYLSITFKGSLDLGVSGWAEDLRFGCDGTQAISLGYWRAFPLGADEPTLGQAAGETISSFVIPAALRDLKLLRPNDMCTVSGQGSLRVAGGFEVRAVPNPLASIDLPLNAGKIEVRSGPMAGISASFAISGSYQIRARCTAPGVIELSVYQEHGTTLKTDLSVSAGVAVKLGSTDLIQSLLTAISPKSEEDGMRKLLADGGLTKDQIDALNGAIKDGLDHCLRRSLDLELADLTDREAAFRYELRLDELDDASGAAVARALKGDLSGLTALEAAANGAVLAPGVKLVSSVLTTARTARTTLKLNLLGLVNFISVTDLIRKSAVVKDPGTGYLTIADSATAQTINAELEPQRRAGVLSKAMLESLMLTATYRVSNVVQMTGITSANFHFVLNDSAKASNFADYLNWFAALDLLTAEQKPALLNQFQAGAATCLLRTEFDQSACELLFFQAPGQLWDAPHYLETGRQAMRALLDPASSDGARFRCELLDQHWQEAVHKGPTDNLGPLVGLDSGDPIARVFTDLLIADVATITWWADAMRNAGEAILEMRRFLGDPASAVNEDEFASRRDGLQQKMAKVMRQSQAEFKEPWGLVALFWAGGSTGASARLATKGFVLQKPDPALMAESLLETLLNSKVSRSERVRIYEDANVKHYSEDPSAVIAQLLRRITVSDDTFADLAVENNLNLYGRAMPASVDIRFGYGLVSTDLMPITELTAASVTLLEISARVASLLQALSIQEELAPPGVSVAPGSVSFSLGGSTLLVSGIGFVVAAYTGMLPPRAWDITYYGGAFMASLGIIDLAVNWYKTIKEATKADTDAQLNRLRLTQAQEAGAQPPLGPRSSLIAPLTVATESRQFGIEPALASQLLNSVFPAYVKLAISSGSPAISVTSEGGITSAGASAGA